MNEALHPAEAEALAMAVRIRRRIPCERVSLFFRHEDGRYVSAVAEGLAGMDLDVKPGEGLAGKALQANGGLVSNHPLHDVRTLSRIRDHYTGYATQSLCARAVPARWGRRPAAIVQLVNAPSGRFGGEDDARLAEFDDELRRLARRMPRRVRNVWGPSTGGEAD